MNTISVSGRVASDVTTKDINGRTVANFRLASQNKHKEKDGNYGTNWYDVAAWGAIGEIAAKYLKKGHRANVSGQLVIRKYMGNDNVERTAVEIEAAVVDLVETKAEAEAKSAAPAQAPAPSAPAFTPVETDELPF